MKLKLDLPKLFVLGFFALGIAMVISKTTNWFGNSSSLQIPTFSQLAEAGQQAFAANCSQCHGTNATGTDSGPPLVHDIYNPGHHDDASIIRAIRSGTRQHHWRFGNMPPQTQVTDSDTQAIIQYVRELQSANGIKYRPHRM